MVIGVDLGLEDANLSLSSPVFLPCRFGQVNLSKPQVPYL